MQFTRDPLLPFILTQRAPFDHHEVVTESRRQTHDVKPYLCSFPALWITSTATILCAEGNKSTWSWCCFLQQFFWCVNSHRTTHLLLIYNFIWICFWFTPVLKSIITHILRNDFPDSQKKAIPITATQQRKCCRKRNPSWIGN